MLNTEKELQREEAQAGKGRPRGFGHSLARDGLRSEVAATTAIIAAAMTSDEVTRLKPSPPWGADFVSVSPSVAPRGRVRTYAAQKRIERGIFVKKYPAATRTIRPAKTSAPFSKPSPASSA